MGAEPVALDCHLLRYVGEIESKCLACSDDLDLPVGLGETGRGQQPDQQRLKVALYDTKLRAHQFKDCSDRGDAIAASSGQLEESPNKAVEVGQPEMDRSVDQPVQPVVVEPGAHVDAGPGGVGGRYSPYPDNVRGVEVGRPVDARPVASVTGAQLRRHLDRQLAVLESEQAGGAPVRRHAPVDQRCRIEVRLGRSRCAGQPVDAFANAFPTARLDTALHLGGGEPGGDNLPGREHAVGARCQFAKPLVGSHPVTLTASCGVVTGPHSPVSLLASSDLGPESDRRSGGAGGSYQLRRSTGQDSTTWSPSTTWSHSCSATVGSTCAGRNRTLLPTGGSEPSSPGMNVVCSSEQKKTL